MCFGIENMIFKIIDRECLVMLEKFIYVDLNCYCYLLSCVIWGKEKGILIMGF